MAGSCGDLQLGAKAVRARWLALVLPCLAMAAVAGPVPAAHAHGAGPALLHVGGWHHGWHAGPSWRGGYAWGGSPFWHAPAPWWRGAGYGPPWHGGFGWHTGPHAFGWHAPPPFWAHRPPAHWHGGWGAPGVGLYFRW